jgi:ABC-2 type transport system permease protein
MRRAFWVALKEVRLFLQDRGDLAFSLLLPIVVFALVYGAFGGKSLFHGTAHIVNGDPGGRYSNLFLERLGKDSRLDIEMHGVADADRKLGNSDLQLVLFIPGDFSSRLEAGEPTALVFKQRGNGGQEGQVVASIIRGVAQQIAQEVRVRRRVLEDLAGKNLSGSEAAVAVQKFIDREREHPTIQIGETMVGAPPDPAKTFLPGIMTMFILFAITLNARAVVEERKKGTLERLMITRLTPGQLFTGKFLAGMLRGFIQALILLILACLVFRFFTPLSFLKSLMIALVFAAAASAVGLMIAVIVRTEDAATWVAVFATMLMAVLGGTFVTIRPGSIWDTLSKFSMNTYANDALKTVILNGGAMADIAADLVVLAGVGAAGILTSRIFFRIVSGGRWSI